MRKEISKLVKAGFYMKINFSVRERSAQSPVFQAIHNFVSKAYEARILDAPAFKEGFGLESNVLMFIGNGSGTPFHCDRTQACNLALALEQNTDKKKLEVISRNSTMLLYCIRRESLQWLLPCCAQQ